MKIISIQKRLDLLKDFGRYMSLYKDRQNQFYLELDTLTQQTEKLNTELEQTKEKLKRCEEVIDKVEYILNRFKTWSQISDDRFSQYSDSIHIDSTEALKLLSQLKDNG